VVTQNDIFWADLGAPAGRRPVCVLTRDAAISVRNAVTCAPITRTIRGIKSEVEIGPDEGLPETCVINCDNVLTVPLEDLDEAPVGFLNEIKRSQLDRRLGTHSTSSTKPSPSVPRSNCCHAEGI
jgi:mRNA interferase MazF